YFKPYGKCQHHRIMGKTHILKWHDETNITRHIPLRVKISPYDGNWSHWGTRKGAYIGGVYPRWGSDGIAAEMRYAFGVIRHVLQKRRLPDAMPDGQHSTGRTHTDTSE